ncbi:MAG: iron-sulfur cofactor synthesis protein [Candidatus Scalindua rubra]|uniref:Iron-sulfur cofactor synthesis protein n=1 Tax=Candidatus Scalindua rubra TaxID=1872076 RepID=A0A1E3X5V7_9BACT|nr:MAG: iron-sulfur cofactor synthesis protein [Candidatus Scalindua rubra]
MEDLYREYILEHYKNPSNYGTLQNPDISYTDSNPLCGDEIRIDINLNDNKVKDVRFQGKGCALSKASASMLTEMIDGMSLEEMKGITKEDIIDVLGITLGPVRIKCALLGLKVLKAGAYGLKGWPGEED